MTLDIAAYRSALLKILKGIYTDTELGPLLGFKGGTAAYLFHDLPRFSVDLDFDLLDESHAEEVFDKVADVVGKYGAIKDKSNKKNTLFILLSYSTDDQNVKIEISKRNFGSRYELRNYLGIPMLVMRQEDMFAHKLVALTERGRTANRDLFDIHYFLNQNWAINGDIIEKRTGRTLAEHLTECIKFIDGISGRSVSPGLGELIDEKQKAWVREKLKSDTIFLLELRLQDLRF